MSILILGKGYIGNYLAAYLETNDVHVLHVSKKDIDYTDPYVFSKFLDKKVDEIDWVINCTGFTGTPNVDGCEDYKELCYYYNVTVPLYITKTCNSLKLPIIHIGSGCVYTGYDKIFTECDTTNFGADCLESSTYSKTKDSFEKLSSNMDRYIFRIRIPFNGVYEPKNYLYKMLKYDNLITKQNSITCVDDLLVFIEKFIRQKPKIETGIYNVVNTGSIDGADVVDMLREHNVFNSKWKFVTIKEACFRVARSNCILSTSKIQKLGLSLPCVRESLTKAVLNFSKNLAHYAS
jgi:dTDP-4-dehydrorhamnose reductase